MPHERGDEIINVPSKIEPKTMVYSQKSKLTLEIIILVKKGVMYLPLPKEPNEPNDLPS